MDWLNSFSKAPGIAIGGNEIPIAIKRHPTAKRLTMRVAPDGSEIRVTMPRWGQSREAIAFAESRLPWLEKQFAAIEPQANIGHGSSLPFRGENIAIRWDASLPRKPVLSRDQLSLGGPGEGLSRRIERWLRAQGLELMTVDLAHYCDKAGVPTPKIALSSAQRRWGSCSTSGTVRMNWRLIMAPDAVRRSVVAHEVAHLIHFDHSPAFHALLGELFEGNISAANHWLKKHGRSLYRHFG